MLDVSQLDFDYPDKQVLQGIQFTVNAGSLLHLRGSNGAGKTTLLKLLAGLLHPTQGDIRFQGCLISDDLATYQQNICYVGHKTGVSQLLTVKENCRFELARVNNLSFLPTSSGVLPFDNLIKSFALEGLEDTPCHLLSVGQRRRVGLLRLLMSDAPLWLLDEPLVALDNESVDLLMMFVQKHLNRGGIIVLSSHQNLPLELDNYQEYRL